MLINLFICPFFFVTHNNQSDFLPAIRARVFKFSTNPDSGKVCCVREDQVAEIVFFSFAHLVRELCIYKISLLYLW